MLQDQDLLALQEVRQKVERAHAAAQIYRGFSQQQVDAIVERAAAAARQESVRLAELAVRETGYGKAEDKLSKNLLCCDLLPRTMRGMKTVGILREDKQEGIVEIAVPVGVVAAVLPTTNPTSTAMYKCLIALKSGNAIVISPHPRARQCTCETAEVIARAAREAGAPEGIVQCIGNSTIEATNALMRHPLTSVILSTGGSGIVKAAYSSGKPAYGVGPGNVPAYVEASANVSEAVANVIAGKTFDYGTICSSEQVLVAETRLRDAILAAIQAQKGVLCTPEQSAALARTLLSPSLTVNPQLVGQPAAKIAAAAGFTVPSDTSILAAEIGGVGKDHPLSAEKLSPVLALLFVQNHAEALDRCVDILKFGGLGHTSVIHSKDDARIREFALRMPAFRVLANTPSPQGSTGITTNVFPAMTLGCGAIAGNSTGDNISPRHLIHIKRLAMVSRTVEEAFPHGAHPIQGGTPVSIDRQAVVAAVERYLAKRGMAETPAPAHASPSPGKATTAEVVDRFLASRQASPAPEPPAEAPKPAPPPASPAVAAKPAPPPAPAPTPVDFVCENDVRMAIQKQAKIVVGPKTIVTPAARELGSQHGILVPTDLP